MCEVSFVYAKRKWSNCAETVNSSNSIHDLDLCHLDPKINRGPPRIMVNTGVKYNNCIKKETELSCGNGIISKSKYDLDLLTPNQYRGPPQVMINICMKYHHCKSNEKGVIVQKPLFHRQTDGQIDCWNQYTTTNFVGGMYTKRQK